MADFERAFEVVVGYEGGFSHDCNDPANWTGGKIGQGELMRTNFAASYPDLDIKNLTIGDQGAL